MNRYFFIVGAQRSGTTYLYSMLDGHPEICMAKPLKPEPKYFLNHPFNEKEYLDKYFRHADSKTKIFGEKSTSYYENESVAKKIYDSLPSSKIVFILANPIDRAISNYRFSYDNGLEKRDIEEVFCNRPYKEHQSFNTSVNPYNYLERGIYFKYLDYYYKYFDKNSIYIIIKEEFTGNLDAVQKLYSFLGVDERFTPRDLNRVINSSKQNIDSEKIAKVKEKLKDYYKNYNQILKDKYHLDISSWQSLSQ